MQQPDLEFVDSYVASVQDEQPADSLDRWVNERLAQDFMRNAAATLRAGTLVMVLTIFLLYGHVNTVGLAVWALAYTLTMAYRRHTIRAFKAMMDLRLITGADADISGFFRKHGWSWPASACIFALPIVLFHEMASHANEYLYLMILVGMGATGAALMAANLKCQRDFSHALSFTSAAGFVVNWLKQWPAFPSRESMIFILLIVLFWVLILYLGKHLNYLQRSSYSAQFGNEQLIRSLRQQTQAATEAVQTKNNLLASAAHDLRQPVHALAFYADWLRNEPQLADSVIPKILAATDSVNTLFNSLFDFARIEAGAIPVNLDEVDIAALIEEMAVQFAPAAHAKGLVLRTYPVQATVYSDGVLLRRITSNLLANAIRYTEKGGVTLSAQVEGGKLMLEIIDSGLGISPEHLPHVFKEFYRAPTHEGTADSFGLGLAIVQRLCRALGHVVTLHSVLGQGTRCRLEIQLSRHSKQSSTSAPMPLLA
ncbi:HAMP domain-containing sensor histidine kinase [Variovorax sp. PCZ-1]|uniref:sensor histidine kinase n=1 Tax=Variovorax sp. PCZ-1 TaxID=2835533 RepID=UPI001BCCEFBE|nr:HAMP domain-containing sensor histidine kinase [Variovorax sp. PCZ-1]MBS7807953.1 HAMP domain-containing histidine kinase [Variovorax sp. PCZ-1]